MVSLEINGSNQSPMRGAGCIFMKIFHHPFKINTSYSNPQNYRSQADDNCSLHRQFTSAVAIFLKVIE